jgi:hypothetical protein
MTIPIVGIDEADLDRGQVSWLSPIRFQSDPNIR